MDSIAFCLPSWVKSCKLRSVNSSTLFLACRCWFLCIYRSILYLKGTHICTLLLSSKICSVLLSFVRVWDRLWKGFSERIYEGIWKSGCDLLPSYKLFKGARIGNQPDQIGALYYRHVVSYSLMLCLTLEFFCDDWMFLDITFFDRTYLLG